MHFEELFPNKFRDFLWNSQQDGSQPTPFQSFLDRPLVSDSTNFPPVAPAKTCAHDAPLLKITDGMAFCEGCGRNFEVREFGRKGDAGG